MICSASCICNWKSASYSLCIYYHDSPHKYHKPSKNTPDDNIYIIWCPGPTQLCHVPFFLPSAHPWIQNKKKSTLWGPQILFFKIRREESKRHWSRWLWWMSSSGDPSGRRCCHSQWHPHLPMSSIPLFFFLLFPMIKAGNDISNKLPANSVAHIQGGIPTSVNLTFRVGFPPQWTLHSGWHFLPQWTPHSERDFSPHYNNIEALS